MTISKSKNSGLLGAVRIGILVILVACFGISYQAPRATADADYKFVDEYGSEIEIPRDVPIYTEQKPGPWGDQAVSLLPQINTWIRYDGLEHIRIVVIRSENPLAKEAEIYHPLESFYIADKDGLIIGYKAFKDTLKDGIEWKFFINGIVNYIQVYVQYKDLGIWKKELRF